MAGIDLRTQLLPDALTLPLLWSGLLVAVIPLFASPGQAILGAAAGYLSLWSVYWAFKLLTGKEGMGYGDFKLLAAIGHRSIPSSVRRRKRGWMSSSPELLLPHRPPLPHR